MEKRIIDMLGHGVYTLAEAARYTNLNPRTVHSWFKPRSDGKGQGPLFMSDYPLEGKESAISFLDMIDLLVAGLLRKEGVKMNVVRKAYDTLVNDFQPMHPFCHRDFYTDGEKIFYETADKVGDRLLIEVTKRQCYFDEIKSVLTKIDYDEMTKFAQRWKISEGVVVDPRICFGKPVIDGTGTTTFVLANQFLANDCDFALVAELYNLSEERVRNAVEFEEKFNNLRAA